MKIFLVDKEMYLVLSIIQKRFQSIAGKIIRLLSDTHLSNAYFQDSLLEKQGLSFDSVFKESSFSISNTDFKQYQEITRQILLGKIIEAD